jgi:hypothetical protein
MSARRIRVAEGSPQVNLPKFGPLAEAAAVLRREKSANARGPSVRQAAAAAGPLIAPNPRHMPHHASARRNRLAERSRRENPPNGPSEPRRSRARGALHRPVAVAPGHRIR